MKPDRIFNMIFVFILLFGLAGYATTRVSETLLRSDAIYLTQEDNIFNRALYVNNTITITVDAGGSGNFTTLQGALDTIPLYTKAGQVAITVNDGDYSSENLTVSPFLGRRSIASSVSEGTPVTITGNQANPGAVKVGSFYADNLAGGGGSAQVWIAGVQFQHDNPYDDEEVCVAHYGGHGNLGLRNVSFASGCTNGVLAYGGGVYCNGCFFGEKNVSDAFMTKYNGWIFVKDDCATGEADDYAYRTNGGGRIEFEGDDCTLTGETALVLATRGTVYDVDNDIIYGYDTTSGDFNIAGYLVVNGTSGYHVVGGSDSDALYLGGGATAVNNDGARIILYGNDYVSGGNEGRVKIEAGNCGDTGCFIKLSTSNSGGSDTTRMIINAGADIVDIDISNANLDMNTGNITIKAADDGTAMCMKCYSDGVCNATTGAC